MEDRRSVNIGERYDKRAADYDSHYERITDRAEDAVLSRYLRPLLNRRLILDLGAGTGLVADLTDPSGYIGVDSSPAMLARLMEKHPEAIAVEADLADPDGVEMLAHFGPVDAIVSLWAAHYLALEDIIHKSASLLHAGGVLFLHGQGPRQKERQSYILSDERDEVIHLSLAFTPDRLLAAAEDAGFKHAQVVGFNAYPDAVTEQMDLNTAIDAISQSPAYPPLMSYHFALLATKE
jgi:SAM-dependent methyltransferase